jgi:hypothetical protein
MSISQEQPPWSERPFIEYVEEVDRLCQDIYGIDSSDCGLDDLDLLASEQEDGETPENLVLWKGEKYGLTSKKEWSALR